MVIILKPVAMLFQICNGDSGHKYAVTNFKQLQTLFNAVVNLQPDWQSQKAIFLVVQVDVEKEHNLAFLSKY